MSMTQTPDPSKASGQSWPFFEDPECDRRMRSSEKFIWELIFSFPCLRIKFGGRPWRHEFDPDKLYEAAGLWSHGEWMCVLFVLNVWNPGYAKQKGWTFDLFEFLGVADQGNRAALLKWANKPVWP